jgi:hypothetical protein
MAWLATPSSNLGWAILPTGSNGVDFESSEGINPPRLTVSFTEPIAKSLVVESTTPSASGVDVHLSRGIDPALLNLYSGQVSGALEADVTLVGDHLGPVAGSLIWQPAINDLQFIKSGGPLLADTYTLRLASRVDGIVDLAGRQLDGDADDLAGGDFVIRFTIADSPVRLLSLPDVVRGPNQPIDLAGTGGIPLTIDDASGLTEMTLTLVYDPLLLNITGGIVLDLPLDWQLSVATNTPGEAVVTASGPALADGPLRLMAFQADVPFDAESGIASPLKIKDVLLNQGDLDTRTDTAVFVTTYLGDATGDGSYSGFDASRVARVAVELDTGFDEFLTIDPVLVGDVTGNGFLSSLDASFIARKAVGLGQAEIPDLPSAPELLTAAVSPLATFVKESASEPAGNLLASWDFLAMPEGRLDDLDSIIEMSDGIKVQGRQAMSVGKVLEQSSRWRRSTSHSLSMKGGLASQFDLDPMRYFRLAISVDPELDDAALDSEELLHLLACERLRD